MSRILIVENYPPLRHAKALTLQRAGWQVVSATSLQEAIQTMVQDDFDVVLLDMDMATGESWRTLQTLSVGPNSPSIVALLDPGNQRQPELEVLGVKVRLWKPVSRDTLLTGVTRALQES